MNKIFFTFLAVLLSIVGLGECLQTTQPPRLDDTYFLILYKNGDSELRMNLDDYDVATLRDDCHVKKVIRTDYSQLATAITQRVYDYHFYFEQYIATDRTTDPVGWEEALDRLMSIFSRDLTSFEAINNFPGGATSWEGVRELYIALYDFFFRGYTLHTAPNVRVIPVCKDKSIQVFVSSGQLDYSRINVNAAPPPQVVTDIGYYNFEFRYERDGVWRFITWQVDNRVQYVDPPLNGTPPPYVPYEEDPITHCNHHHHQHQE